ncbi:MAG: hypothetical protein WHT08_06300 [Bryobacteraceae bacterium]
MRLLLLTAALLSMAELALGQDAARMRGIEKKDIRVVVLYDDARISEKEANELANALRASPELQEKLTKADAARSSIMVAKESGERCPPAGCGCFQSGATSCFCVRFGKYCACYLCIEDLKTGPADRAAVKPMPRPLPPVVIVLAGYDDSAVQKAAANPQELERIGREAAERNPQTSALVIKTKSSNIRAEPSAAPNR